MLHLITSPLLKIPDSPSSLPDNSYLCFNTQCICPLLREVFPVGEILSVSGIAAPSHASPEHFVPSSTPGLSPLHHGYLA